MRELFYDGAKPDLSMQVQSAHQLDENGEVVVKFPITDNVTHFNLKVSHIQIIYNSFFFLLNFIY